MANLELDFAFFAHGAEPGVTGKLHIYGAAFERIRLSSLPATIPPFVIVLRMYSDSVSETETHSLRISVLNPVGEETVVGDHDDVEVKPPPLGQDVSYASAVLTMAIGFIHEGKHLFRVEIDGNKVKELPLWVQVVPDSEGAS